MGTDGEEVLSGHKAMKPGSSGFDWLGPGIYFWERDPDRALDWAKQKHARGACAEPFVIGAVIDLGDCLDFTMRENVVLLRDAFESFSRIQKASGLALPSNKKAKNDPSPSLVLRYLDHAVINHLLTTAEEDGKHFDTVHGLFSEGKEAFPGSGILAQAHAQIAVRNVASIKGVFRHPPFEYLT